MSAAGQSKALKSSVFNNRSDHRRRSFGCGDVFAGGDCSVNTDDPQPATAQVAYQQGAAIAANISALIDGDEPSAAEVNLRGTLLKLGMEKGAAEIFDRFEISGHLGHVVRHATYLSLLPTPARNIKVGAQWLTDEIFEQVLDV
ncbi:MAG: hypothetical protein ACFB2W_26565 [Leptolyngbyaceae cyanobacterium]